MIRPISDIRLQLVAGDWPLDHDTKTRVDDHWQKVLENNPHLWNGRVLGTRAPGTPGGIVIEDGVLTAEAVEGDFAAFLAWRDWGFPEIGLRNLFGSALIRSADGALVYGVMGKDTANAGRVYPPGGSLEPSDADDDGHIGVIASIEREMMEETGLVAGEAVAGPIYAAFDGPRVSIGRIYDFPVEADALVARIAANLDRQEERELARVIALRSVDTLAGLPAPGYARAFAENLLAK